MKVLFVTPDHGGRCGVKDYTHRLSTALEEIGVSTAFVCPATKTSAWKFYAEVRDSVRQEEADILHVEYPMAAFGSSILPHGLLLLANCPVVTTLHEFREAHLLRRLSMFAFVCANALIFTSDYERASYDSWYPLRLRSRGVIPIGSNIPYLVAPTGRVPNEVVFFGLIRPDKGLEQFLRLACIADEERSDFRFRVIGAIPDGQEAYYRKMRKKYEVLDSVVWDIGLNEVAVAERLAQAEFAYLWYPDGASERRGSLHAALGNGVVVVTRSGRQTPKDLGAAVRFAEQPGEAFRVLTRLSESNEERAALRAAGLAWAARFTWEAIALRHKSIYESLL